MDDAPVPIGGWIPRPPADLDEHSGPTGSAAVAAAAGGLATWLPDGRWSTPADLATPPPEPRRRFLRRSAPSARSTARRLSIGRGRRVRRLRVVARLAGWPRRVAALGFAMAAVLLMLRPDPASPGAPAAATVPVVVVAGDLPAGTTLSREQLRTAALPASVVPAGASRDVRAVVGRVVAGPVRRGEPLTDARLLGPGLTAGLDATESAAAPVRLADPDSASLVRPGDRVDVLGTPVQPDGGSVRDAVTLATSVRVLAVVRGDDAAAGVLLVVATAPSVARRLAGAAAGHRLTVAVRPP